MASTYSANLKFELMGTGEQSGLWGSKTNTNLGTAVEEAIVGQGTANFASDADLTLTLTNSSASQVARALVLNVTGTISATRNLVVPTINKPYVVRNNTTGGQSVIVKTSAGSGITVPNGKTAWLYTDGTNVVEAMDTLTNLSYTGTLTGGTGVINIGSGQIYKDSSGRVALGRLPSSWAFEVANVSGGNYCTFGDGTNDFGGYVSGSKAYWGTLTNTPLALMTNGAEKATIDAAGNLGLGVTPSAWSTNRRAFQIGGNTVSALGLSAGISEIGHNSVSTVGGYIYAATAPAGLCDFNNAVAGGFAWKIAPSGTAGNPISFTQAMTLDASGNLLVGTTSLAGLGVSITPSSTIFQNNNAAATGFVFTTFRRSSTEIGSITQNGTTAVSYNTSSDYRLKNITGAVTNSGAYIDSLNPVEGTWKADGSTFVGLIAHEVQEASRTQVATGVKDGEEMQAMDYSSSELIANMIAELKSLRARVAQLESN